MTPPHPPTAADPPRRGTARGSLGVALAVPAVLATVGSFGVGFGVLTACTDEYSCTVTDCAPCATANDWLTAGWVGQALLLLAAVVLVPAAPHAAPVSPPEGRSRS